MRFLLIPFLLFAFPAQAELRPLQDYFIVCELDDVSTASSTYCVIPSNGKIIKIQTVLHGAITVADADITATINGTAITGCTITIAQSGSSAGDVDSCTPTGANDAVEDNYLQLTTDGASSTAARVTLTVIVRR